MEQEVKHSSDVGAGNVYVLELYDELLTFVRQTFTSRSVVCQL